MKKILIALVVVIICVLGTLVLTSSMKGDVPPDEVPNTPTQFPNATPNPTPQYVDPYPDEPIYELSEDKISLQLPRGGRMETNDFIANGVTIPDPVNPGTHVLAGTLGYCLPDGSCPTGAETKGFTVTYAEQYNVFTIILEEPLRVNRSKAEEFMMKTLGIERRDLCDIPYWIGTTSYINALFSGQDLRFSFCPGAVALP